MRVGKSNGVSAADPCHWIPSVWGAGGGYRGWAAPWMSHPLKRGVIIVDA